MHFRCFLSCIKAGSYLYFELDRCNGEHHLPVRDGLLNPFRIILKWWKTNIFARRGYLVPTLYRISAEVPKSSTMGFCLVHDLDARCVYYPVWVSRWKKDKQRNCPGSVTSYAHLYQCNNIGDGKFKRSEKQSGVFCLDVSGKKFSKLELQER